MPMHKTLLVTLFISASALAIPAMAQVNLGGAARVGAAANAGAVMPNAVHTLDQTGTQAGHALQPASRQTKQSIRHTAHRAHSAVNDNGRVDASMRAGGTMGAGAGGNHTGANAAVRTGASVDAGAAADQAGHTGQRMGNGVSHTVQSAIRTTDGSVRSVGRTAGQRASGTTLGADANVNADADAHGH
jgi:type IV secretory pathway TrbL component